LRFTEGELLVEMAEVGGRVRGFRRDLRMAQEAEHVQPVVDRDDDDAPAGDALAVELHLGRVSDLEPAAEKPDEHRKLLVRAFRRRPDVQVEAILAHRDVRIDSPFPRVNVLDVDFLPNLQGNGRKLIRLEHAFPILRGLRRPPTVLAHGRGGIRNPLETGNAGIRRREPLNDAVFHTRNSETDHPFVLSSPHA